jgi:glycosyltransferase involved in cell wall biosynthesis
MIRIVHVISGLMTGGAEVMLSKLAAATDRNRFEPIVVSLSDASGPVGVEIERLGVAVHYCSMRRPVPGPASALGFLRLVRRLEPDILQGWMYHSNLAALAAAATLPTKVPVLWNIRGSHCRLRAEKPATAAAIWMSARLSSRPDRIVNNSRLSASLHEQELGFARGKWEFIPNGFDLDRFPPAPGARQELRAELGIPPEAPLVGILGRDHPMKDHANFLRAAALARLAMPDLHFVMAGAGLDPQNPVLRQLISALGLGGNVHLLGERRDTPRLCAAFDLATSSSWAEGFPNAIGEAMSCAVPCVVTDAGDCRRLVGRTGLIVPPRDAAALARGWLELLRAAPAAREALGRAARLRIVEHFSLRNVAAQYESLYEDVFRQSGSRKGVAPCAA